MRLLLDWSFLLLLPPGSGVGELEDRSFPSSILPSLLLSLIYSTNCLIVPGQWRPRTTPKVCWGTSLWESVSLGPNAKAHRSEVKTGDVHPDGFATCSYDTCTNLSLIHFFTMHFPVIQESGGKYLRSKPLTAASRGLAAPSPVLEGYQVSHTARKEDSQQPLSLWPCPSNS